MSQKSMKTLIREANQRLRRKVKAINLANDMALKEIAEKISARVEKLYIESIYVFYKDYKPIQRRKNKALLKAVEIGHYPQKTKKGYDVGAYITWEIDEYQSLFRKSKKERSGYQYPFNKGQWVLLRSFEEGKHGYTSFENRKWSEKPNSLWKKRKVNIKVMDKPPIDVLFELMDAEAAKGWGFGGQEGLHDYFKERAAKNLYPALVELFG